jgi:CPA2 family monovalent cation:H+ antiporter-2
MLIVTRLSGADTSVAFRTAAQLAQAGEFGFVLLTLASEHRLLTPEVVQPSLAGMLLSMLAAPFVIERARHWGARLSQDEWLRHAAALQEVAAHAFNIRTTPSSAATAAPARASPASSTRRRFPSSPSTWTPIACSRR